VFTPHPFTRRSVLQLLFLAGDLELRVFQGSLLRFHRPFDQTFGRLQSQIVNTRGNPILFRQLRFLGTLSIQKHADQSPEQSAKGKAVVQEGSILLGNSFEPTDGGESQLIRDRCVKIRSL
jgi:hypothetical protein